MSDAPSSPPELPRAQDILAVTTADDHDILAQQRQFERRFSDSAVQSQAEYEDLKGIKAHYFHKKWWSWFLMGIMATMLIFQSVLLTLVGLGFLDFSQYKWLLPSLLVQNLGQVIALAYVVVKSLFR